MPTDFSQDTGSQFEEDLNRARGYKPVTQKELSKAYSQYEKQGLKFGQVDKGDTDEELYRKAERTVLQWWKAQHKKKSSGSGGGGQPKEHRPGWENGVWVGLGPNSHTGTQGSSGGGSGITSRPPSSGGAGTPRSGGSLPDTAMKGGEGPNTFLNATEVRQITRELGIPDHWNPPMAATRSEFALRTWAENTAQNHDMYIRGEGLKAIYDRATVYRIAREYGVRIDISKVPISARTSVGGIRNYMARLLKAQQMKEAQAREAARRGDLTSRTSAPDIIRSTTGFQR